MRPMHVLTAVWFLCLAAFLLLIITMGVAKSHEAPLGWAYDYECCTGVDCRQAKVREVATGFMVPSGELIPFGDRRIRESKDEFYHWCTVRGEDHTPTLCLYVPHKGF